MGLIMKIIVFVIFSLTIFYGCGSTNSSVLCRADSFDSKDFFNSAITIYPPLSVDITNKKYSEYKSETAKEEITWLLKEKLESVTRQANIKTDNQLVPSYFRGVLMGKDAAMEFIKESKTKYLVFIQSVFIGEDSKQQSMRTNTGIFNYNQSVTKTTMFFSIWNKETATLVFSFEVSADINDGLLINSLNSSFNNALSEFVNYLKKN